MTSEGVLKELGISAYGDGGRLLRAQEVWLKVISAIDSRRDSGEWTVEEAALRYDALLPEETGR